MLVVSDILDPAFHFMHLFFNEMAISFKAVFDIWFVWSVAALNYFRCTRKNTCVGLPPLHCNKCTECKQQWEMHNFICICNELWFIFEVLSYQFQTLHELSVKTRVCCKICSVKRYILKLIWLNRNLYGSSFMCFINSKLSQFAEVSINKSVLTRLNVFLWMLVKWGNYAAGCLTWLWKCSD